MGIVGVARTAMLCYESNPMTDDWTPPRGMKPVIANPQWSGYRNPGNWTHDAAQSALAPYVHQHMIGWPDGLVGRDPFKVFSDPEWQLLRFPGWRDVGAGARVWDDGTDPDWPDHVSPFVD